jgi:hypothetical protein
MRNLKALGVGAVLALAIPALASAVTYTGSFSGAADHDGSAPGVYAAGTNYTARMTLDAAQQDPWYPWNPAKEYTVVLDVVVDTYTVIPNGLGPGIDIWIADFEPASVDIYEDDTTPADYANPGTFTDGTLVLSGQANNMIATRADIFGLPYDVTGVVVFTGGAGFGNLLGCAPSGLSMNDFIDFQIATPPAGYEENYDAEWKCLETTSVDQSTWGNIKGLYR